ncbi:MAG: amidohydrolase family protein, partial [Opitutales bacterium]
EALYHSGRCGLPRLLATLTHKPAAILGLPAGTLAPGAKGDVVVFDPDEAWTVDAETIQSKSANCPWHGRTLRGRVKATFVEGRLVWDGQRILAD